MKVNLYSTKQAAMKIGFVGPDWVRERMIDLYELDHPGIGHNLKLSNAQIKFIGEYADEWYRSSKAPGIRKWAINKEIPKLREINLPMVVKKKSDRTSKQSDDPQVIRRIRLLEEQVKELKEQKELERRSQDRQIDWKKRKLLLGPWESKERKKITKTVRSWVNERVENPVQIHYKKAFSAIYLVFWKKENYGPAPREWYQSQLENEYKLDFFEQYEWIDILLEALPDILVTLSEDIFFDDSHQQELEL